MKLLATLVGCIGLALASVPAQDADQPRADRGQPGSAAERNFVAGLEKQHAADLAVTGPEARELYRAAATKYQAATGLKPDFHDAHLNWAMCLIQIGTLAPEANERNQALMEANQRFAIASRCTGTDYIVYQEWAGLLIGSIYGLVVEQSHRITVLQEVRDVCRRGLQITTEPTPRAELERLLGSSLMMLAEFATDLAEQRDQLSEAIEHLRAAQQSVTVRDTLYQSGNLGIALMSLGRFVKDPALLREAAAEFEGARQIYPNTISICYNLAATWSLLGDTDQAAKYLALTIDQDPSGAYLRLAQRDPDLAAVRKADAYAAAIDRRRRRAAEARAAIVFRQAVAAFQMTERTKDIEALTRQLQEVTTAGEQVIQLTPEAYPAHALAADAFVRLAGLCAPRSDEQQRFAAAAQARFVSASKCSGVPGTVYERWGRFLVHDLYPLLPAGAERDALLQRARRVLQDGVKRARFSESRGRLEMELGTCLVLLAQTGTAVTNRTALYVEAARRFQAADATHSVSDSTGLYETWGVALLRAGQAKKDSLLLRQAVERLSKSLELTPRNAVAHYHLAGAYAQLRQTERALRHLQTSFELEPQSPLRQAAQQDPSLEPLRRSGAYRRLFPAEPGPPAMPIPPISED